MLSADAVAFIEQLAAEPLAMIQRSPLSVVAGLLLVVLSLLVAGSGCSSEEQSVCARGFGSSDTHCLCREGKACSFSCPETAESCGFDCFSDNTTCSLTGGNNCGANCQGSIDCSVSCLDDATVACQGTTGTCSAEVGERARVGCDFANDCQVSCHGACEVSCITGRCRVVCDDPATCVLHCDKQAGVLLCADGVTRVCGTDC